MEFLGAHAAEVEDEEGQLLRLPVAAPWLERAKEALEDRRGDGPSSMSCRPRRAWPLRRASCPWILRSSAPSCASRLTAAFRAIREAAGHWVDPGDCLELIARHFIETWAEAVPPARTRQAKAIARDRGYCQVPGCSRAAAHAHHVRFRSAGGSDDLYNLVAVCAAHHLIAIHRGYLLVTGQAPDGLCWELADGVPFRPGADVPPLVSRSAAA